MYTDNEIAEATAMRDLTLSILGDQDKYSHKEVKELSDIFDDHVEVAIEEEKYHLAEVFTKIKKQLN